MGLLCAPLHSDSNALLLWCKAVPFTEDLHSFPICLKLEACYCTSCIDRVCLTVVVGNLANLCVCLPFSLRKWKFLQISESIFTASDLNQILAATFFWTSCAQSVPEMVMWAFVGKAAACVK